MEYNDEQILTASDYENMARAYASTLKNRGFIIVQVDNDKQKEEIAEIFNNLYKIKSCLFSLGGFMNTSQFFSLNERQLKKLIALFDYNQDLPIERPPRDKTKCFLTFLSTEFLLIKNLISLIDKTNYESQLKDIINARLSLLSKLLEFR